MNNFSPSHGKRTSNTRHSFSCYYSPNFYDSYVKGKEPKHHRVKGMIETVLIPITLFILGLTIKNTRDIGKLCGKLNNEKA
tara:strand:- start:275 stop:517 length:243 start_codon:yes stop_codon:yes gene_type:complete